MTPSEGATMGADFWVGLGLGIVGTLVMVFAGRSFFFPASRLAAVAAAPPAKPTPAAPAVTTAPPPPKPAAPPKPTGEALRLLAVLQREGRLCDFLLEEIQSYSDQQIGASVRDIHQKCAKALREHLELEPILDKPEESTVEVPANFDPAQIRLTGNVTGQPPFQGVLIHRGWRVRKINLAPPAKGQDEFVLQPAEVELR
jgi:hypothetical protein